MSTAFTSADGSTTGGSTTGGSITGGSITGGSTTGGSTTVVETTTPTTFVSESEEMPVASCDCVEDNGDGPRFSQALCGWSPCGRIEFNCNAGDNEDSCDPNGGGTLDVDAVDCALAVLVAGEPAYIEYYETPNAGFSYARGLIKIGEGRKGVTHRWHGVDLATSYGAVEVSSLRDADYFVGCQAKAPLERYACLKQWTQGSVLETCAEAPEMF